MTAAPIHATTVAIGGRGVLLLGASGSGKSDLALRLIDRGALLVSDDYTALDLRLGILHAAPPPTIAGKIEVRGLGIISLPHVDDVPITLAVRLVDAVERMPDAVSWSPPPGLPAPDKPVPLIALDPRAASAPIIVELALRSVR